jgi:hypothetical protein
MLSLSDALRSRYLTYRGLTSCGIDAARAATITDIVHGPEPAEDDVIGPALEWRPTAEETFQPGPADWQSYVEWSDRLDAPYPAEYPASHVTDA